jgi:uncharacterized membrane protein
MAARWQQLLGYLAEAFWLRPAILVLLGALLGEAMVSLERAGNLPESVRDLVYAGGAEGARGLLAALATSSLGVAGTIFSITIAALSLASGQMGPRLLRNFTRDPGNQLALGAFLATFAYALIVLRTVQGKEEGDFVPHLAVSVGVGLGFLCVGVLVWFVHHAAAGINVEHVVESVYGDLRRALQDQARDEPGPTPPASHAWAGASALALDADGYLQHIDERGLADWAKEQGCRLRLLVRPGQRVCPGATLALVEPAVDGAEAALRNHLAIGASQLPRQDLEFAARQLAEVAVRALSPGINDPNTALGVLDRVGSGLCAMAGRHLPSGVVLREGEPVLVRPVTDYAGLLDTMLHMLRQNAEGQPSVIIRLLETLAIVATAERMPGRLAVLRAHAELAYTAGLGSDVDRSAREAIEDRMRSFLLALETGRLV